MSNKFNVPILEIQGGSAGTTTNAALVIDSESELTGNPHPKSLTLQVNDKDVEMQEIVPMAGGVWVDSTPFVDHTASETPPHHWDNNLNLSGPHWQPPVPRNPPTGVLGLP